MSDIEWEYYQMWWDCGFVRIGHDGRAEVWEVDQNAWVRKDAWYLPVRNRGDGSPVDEEVAFATIASWMEGRQSQEG